MLAVSKSTAASPLFHSLNYHLLHDNIIKAGPVVGVLIAGKENAGSPPVARRARIYRELSQHAAQKNIFMYFFHAHQVDWNNQKVRGFFYDPSIKNGKWRKAAFCLPDIIYNRISFRHKEETEDVKELMMKARLAKIPLFNSRFLNKWEVYQSLVRHPQTREFVPETDSYSSENLAKYLNKYHEFFIKPVANSIGKGIIKVISNQPDKIEYFRLGRSSNWHSCRSHEELYQRLSIPPGEKYILQKGIILARIDNRIFDIRAQVQKDGQGKWQFTGARQVGGHRQIFTHVPNGGSKRDYRLTIMKYLDLPAR
jgi:hypothetical protein